MKKTVYQYSIDNFNLLRTKILSFIWDVLYNGTVDEACNFFTKQFLTFIDVFIPSKKVTIRPDNKPWFNGELRTLCRKRDRLKQLAYKLEIHLKTRKKKKNMKKTC